MYEVKGLMKNMVPEIIANYGRFKEMPMEMSAYIDEALEGGMPMSLDVEDIREFLSIRFEKFEEAIAELEGTYLPIVDKE